MLKITQLNKKFPSGFLLGPINLEVQANDCIAILGHNGSGKTTLFQIITGNLDPSDGEVNLDSEKIFMDCFSIKKEIGYLPQNPALPKWISGRELLNYISGLEQDDVYKSENIQNLIDYWECREFIDRPLEACSHGMQKRIGLCIASLRKPKLMVLDEPFSGLDLNHTLRLVKLLQNRKIEGSPTIFSCHIPQYIAKLADWVYFLKNGSLIKAESWQGLDLLQRINVIEAHFSVNETAL
ncbi:MAG: ABC transporter ATP-binding protein [Oligoflexales bacterium]|nr:ABC transporter ATP-binding protein [Oligoflexales bacterium]